MEVLGWRNLQTCVLSPPIYKSMPFVECTASTLAVVFCRRILPRVLRSAVAFVDVTLGGRTSTLMGLPSVEFDSGVLTQALLAQLGPPWHAL